MANNKYDELRAKLVIDLTRVDQELVSQPLLLQESAELAAQMASEEHAARHAADIISAEAAQRLRDDGTSNGGKAPSEARISSEILLMEDVRAARDAYDAARLESARCNALYASMRERVRLLGKACDMTVAGFIVPNSYSPRRSTLMKRE